MKEVSVTTENGSLSLSLDFVLVRSENLVYASSNLPSTLKETFCKFKPQVVFSLNYRLIRNSRSFLNGPFDLSLHLETSTDRKNFALAPFLDRTANAACLHVLS